MTKSTTPLPPLYRPRYALFIQSSTFPNWELHSIDEDLDVARATLADLAANNPNHKVWLVELLGEADLRVRDHLADRSAFLDEEALGAERLFKERPA